MILNIKKGASGDLAKSRCPRDDLAHLIRSDFVSAEPEKFTGDVLNLAHAKTETHQSGADCHKTAAHQSGEAAIIVGGCDCGFCAGNLIDQCLNLVGRPLTAEEVQDDADGFFSDSTIDAGLHGQPPYQLVHIAPPSTGDLTGSSLSKKHLELPKNEIQAITSNQIAFELRSPIECCSNARVNCKGGGNYTPHAHTFRLSATKRREVHPICGIKPFIRGR
jgi:hypothetical protein